MSHQPPEPPADARLAVDVVQQLLRLADIVRDQIGDALAEAAVNETRLTVMRTIADRGDDGCSQADLACVLHQAESSVCTLIERMKKDGLVHRFRSKVDRRKSFLMLTAEGADQLRDAAARHEEAATRVTGHWDAAAVRQTLADLLFALECPADAATVPMRKAA